MKLITSVVALSLMSGAAFAQAQNPAPSGTMNTPPAATNPATMNRPATPNTSAAAPTGSAPAPSFTVTNYYKQDVYDPSDNKIGTIDDVLIDKGGDITALMISVGGFLGIGEKTVKTDFDAVKMTKKNDKWYLTMNATKESLESAPGFKYDRTATTWVPDSSNSARKVN